MIVKYTQHLITNLPKDIHLPVELDLVLSGGAFNGSYILGSLYYIKELENQKLVKVKRISGSSIGSILGLLYFADKLDLFNDFYRLMFKDFNKKKNMSKLLDLSQLLKDKLPSNICDIIKNRFYLSYNNIQLCKKTVKRKYNNVDELLDYIIRSCYVPYLIDYNSAYKTKYIDGMVPYIFNKNKNRKILNINVFTHDKLCNVLNVKNESTNLHRILTGVIDVHLFFIKEKNTGMCSYVDDWSLYEYFVYYISIIIEYIIIYLMYYTKKINNKKIVKMIFKEIIHFCMTTYLV
jgi:hypothetical protein